MLSTLILVLIVVIFIATFVVPIARKKSQEGFADAGGYQSYMGDYLSQRKGMIDDGKRVYNNLGASLDPILPSFAVAPADIDNNSKLTIQDYLKQFNKLTDSANQSLTQSLGNPDIAPSSSSPTNMGPVPSGVKAQLPPPNDLLVKARQCEADLKGRASCSKLNDPTYASCGICIDGGTRFSGADANTFIGGLLSLVAERNDAVDAAAGGTPIFQPTVGKCPPGMFYVDADSCTKAVNQLNCKEIGDTGGFQGGKTHEGLQIPQVSCAQAPVQNVYLYQPANEPYNVTLRFLTPFGTGITKAVVTHVATNRTFVADNGGQPGREFTLEIRGVREQDAVNVMIVQEEPHRPNGKPEVFQVVELDSNGGLKQITDQSYAKSICTRIGTNLATKAQVSAANNAGLQTPQCGTVSDSTTPVYSVQSGYQGFVGVGSHASSDFCNAQNVSVGPWCYGFKPKKSINPSIQTYIRNFFESFGTNAQPAQGASIYSQYADPESNDPPGTSERAVLIQWEMSGSNNRTVSFQPTITKVNGYILKSTTPGGPQYPDAIRLLGPFADSYSIKGPAWNSNMTMQKNQFWFWSAQATSQTAVFTAMVPGYLQDPYYSDDLQNAPIGPLITNPNTSVLLQTSPCFADGQTPGNYSAACLLSLFEGAGGDPAKGTLATENGGLSQLNKYGDLGAIDEYVNDLYVMATSGKDSNGNLVSLDMDTRIAAMNDAAMKLFGFKITNPCEDLVDNADGSVGLVPKPMGNVTADCLQYLWLNNEDDGDRSGTSNGLMYSNTYTSIADRFSGLRYNESTPKRRSQYPFQACQLTGSMAPIKNGVPDQTVIGQLTSMASLQAVQDFFNNIQKTANYGKDQKAQAVAIQQCYGINQAKNKALGYGCTLIMPPGVVPGVTCYVNLGDPTEVTNYLTYSNGAAFFGGVQNSPNITFKLAPPNNGQAGCISFKTTDPSPLFLRHSGFRIWAQSNDGSSLFAADSTWKVVGSLNNNSTMVSFQSVNYPDHYFSRSGGPNEVWSTIYSGTAADADLKSFTIIGVPAVATPVLGVKARYVEVDVSDMVDAGQKYIQIAQLQVFDSTGTNVALRKPTNQSTPTWSENRDGDSPDKAVDGTASPRPYPNMYHSGSSSNGPIPNAFFMVDLQDDYDIVKVVYYNRTDCCSDRARGMKLKLLDANRNVVATKVFPNGDPVITFDFTNTNQASSPLSKYKLYSGSDSAGLDIACFTAGSVDEVLGRCESDSKCVGFITATNNQNQIGLGCTKYGINNNGISTRYAPNATWKTVDSYIKTQGQGNCSPPSNVPSGTFSGDWIAGAPSATSVNVDDQCNTVAMFHSPDNYVKMVNNKGVAKYFSGDVSQYAPSSWGTYNSAQGHYFFNGF